MTNDMSKNKAVKASNGTQGLWLAAIIFILISLGGTLPTPLYSFYRQKFHFSEITLTLIYAAYVAGTLAMLAFFGRLSDQIGRIRTIWIAIAIALGSTFVFIFAANIPMLFIGRVLSGASVGLAAGTITAWIAELYPDRNKSSSTLWPAASNMLGLGLGPLLTGLLVFAMPLRLNLAYIVFLPLLLLTIWLSMAGKETIDHPVSHFAELSLRPRFGVPADKRAAFISPAVGAFAAFAMMGFYTGLLPGLLSHSLHIKNTAVTGAIVLEFFVAGATAIIAFAWLPPVAAMLTGLIVLLPSLALLILAERLHGLGLLLAATAIGGAAVGLGYRGSLQRINAIASDDNKAELVSTYFLFCYSGISLPVIGIGVITELASAKVADLAFAIIIASLAMMAFTFGLRHKNKN
jgi:MFS family permease